MSTFEGFARQTGVPCWECGRLEDVKEYVLSRADPTGRSVYYRFCDECADKHLGPLAAKCRARGKVKRLW